jgi:hypothetical protein
MSTRTIGVLILALMGLPLIIFGPEQYGYAFFGLLAGLGAFAKMIGAQSPIWMIVLPILTIVLMIFFATAAITALGFSVMQIMGYPQTIIQHRQARFIPTVFAFSVITGLALVSTFPGEPPIRISSSLFLFPCAVMLVSIIHAFQKQ